MLFFSQITTVQYNKTKCCTSSRTACIHARGLFLQCAPITTALPGAKIKTMHPSGTGYPEEEEDLVITLPGARRLAALCYDQWTEVYHNEKSRIVSFVRDDARINVYYTTETVATVLDHPSRGRSQLFRAEVDLSMLEQLFDNPRMHTGVGYRDLVVKDRVNERLRSTLESEIPNEEETELQEQMENVDETIKRLKKYRANLAEIHRTLKEKRMREEERERKRKEQLERQRKANTEARIDKETKERGRKLSLCYMKNLHNCLQRMDMRDTMCIALHPESHTVLYAKRDGQSFWDGGGVPEAVDNALRNRVGEHCRPTAIALGTEGRYFMQFANGKELWNGSDSFEEEIAHNAGVKMVAFGEEFDSYFILYKNSAAWRNIPKAMEDYVEVHSRQGDLPNVAFVSLGEGRRYFIRFEDGSWRAGGLRPVEKKLVDQINAKGNIREMYFGAGGMVLRYN